MNINKINYSINRSYNFYHTNRKDKYKKITKYLSTFYNEGINNKEKAIELRDNAIAYAKYQKRKCSRKSCGYGFKDYCNSTKLLKKLFNLE